MAEVNSNSAKLRRGRRWMRFSLRAVFAAVTVSALASAWLGLELARARRQTATVQFIVDRGGSVEFDYLLDDLPPLTGPGPYPYRPPKRNVPMWLRSLLGDPFFVRPERVSLSGDALGPGVLQRVATLSRVNWIRIEGNVFGEDLAHLARLKRLTGLWIGESNLSDQDLIHLRNVTQLKTLTISYARIKGEGLVHLQGILHLTKLELHNTEVDTSGVAHLVALPKLEELKLDRTRVTDGVFGHLAAMPSLKRVDLSDNYITDGAISEIKKLHSRMDIVLHGTEITLEGTIALTGSDDRYSMPNASFGLPSNGTLEGAVSSRNVDRVRWLLAQGADPNRGHDGWTPLHMAAANGELEMIRMLLEHGAKLTTRNSRGITPLEAARENHHQAAVDILTEAERSGK